MLTYIATSIFDSPAQVLVNTVNTEGIMGKGIALQFRKIFPDMFKEYQSLCEKGQIEVGKLWLFKSPHKWVLNFPTKRSWRQPSQLEYIEKGLSKFVSEFGELGIYSIAFPALGCGNGELQWSDVKPLMEKYLKRVPADIFIHPPIAATGFPEHRSQEEVTDWLRSEPRSLGFSEVWADLKNVIGKKDTFSTSNKEYTVRLLPGDTRGIEVKTESRNYRIEYEDLQEVWAVFRTHGYLRRGIVTNAVEKVLYYLMPIFAELPYVGRIELSDDDAFSADSHGRSLSGLQYYAPSTANIQPSLFL